MLNNVQAVMFDMDGTLIDSKKLIESAWVSTAKKYAVEVNSAFIEQHIHGREGSYTLNKLFEHFSPEQRQVIKQEVDNIEETALVNLIFGAKALLIMLRNYGLRTALVTASWPARIQHVFEQHHLHEMFDVVISRDDVQQGKPAPDGYLLAAEYLQCDITRCLVFEDSSSGIEAAISSGARCVVLGRTQNDHPRIVGQFDNFTTFILSLRPTYQARRLSQ